MQQQGNPNTTAATTNQGQQIQILQGAAQTSGQTFTIANAPQLLQVQLQQQNAAAASVNSSNQAENTVNNSSGSSPHASHSQVLQISGQSGHQASSSGPGQIQIVQPVITSNGEIVQQIPIQLTPHQLQLIRMQLQGQGSTNQPIIVQAAPISQTAVSGSGQYQIQSSGGQHYLTSTVITGNATSGGTLVQDHSDQVDDDETRD